MFCFHTNRTIRNLTMADERQLTELEGAVLEAVQCRDQDTAYKIRRAFERSFSVQWRGSAGAISPAVHRLEARGLLRSAPHPTRRGKVLALTAEGKEALLAWAKDTVLASGAGMDPFRLRAGVWLTLSETERRTLFKQLAAQLRRDTDALEQRDYEDPPDRIQSELAMELLGSRIDWLKQEGRRVREPAGRSPVRNAKGRG
jgi:DNA-binding PadR family transcriptional regulator